MPTPPPDPTGRPSSAKRAPEATPTERTEPGEGGPSTPANNEASSTGSHHPAAPSSEPLSDLIQRSGAPRRAPTGSDILQMLGNPGASPIAPSNSGDAGNTDDAPTVITRNHAAALPHPLPLPVTGDPPSVSGRRLGHFELIGSIGAGGMAAVLKARDLELGRVVALKILPPEAARDPESVTRFKQEARAAAMLDHENVARVYFCGEDQGLHFIAFEFVEGENLRQLIDRRGPIPPGECVRYMIQVAAGLNHAAERGVVHRDIKPSNIIITPDGRAKIVDMGLARQLESGANGGVTHSGVTLGTFDYISPEQALDPRRADVRSDIYSLGCAFYHALTGRPPVPEGTAAKKLHAHQHVDPLDPRQINPAIPDDLAAVLAGMMAKDPDQRYQTPADLIAHLKGVAERLKLSLGAVATDSAVQAVPASQAVLREPRLRLGWVVAAAAVAIAVAAFALSTGDRPAPPPWPDSASKNAGDGVGTTPGPQPNPGHPAAESVVAVHTAEGLAEALANPKTTRVHLDAGTYDLTTLSEGVAFAGKDLELVGSPAGVTKIVLTAARNHPANGRAAPGTLSIRADAVTIRAVRFELHADPTDILLGLAETAAHPAGLVVQSATQVNLFDCAFACRVPAEEEAIAVAVLANPDAPPVRVRVERCAFGHKDVTRGGIAVQVPARSEVEVVDSGFGPHAAAIQVHAPRDGETEPMPAPAPGSAAVRLFRSSFMLDPKCAAVTTTTPVTLTAGYCVFAPVGVVPTTPPADPFGTVFHTARLDGLKFTFTGVAKNAYYRVNPLAVGSGDKAQFYTLDECRALPNQPVTDKEAVALAQRPWSEPKPLDALADAEPWRAFRLKIETEPALFLPKDKDPRVRVVGVQFHNDLMLPSRRAYPDLQWPPLEPATSAAEERRLVWYPNPPEGEPLPKDTYADLDALLKAARSGDKVLIRHDGLLRLERTAELKVRGGATDFRLTFKPFPGSKPILTATGDQVLDQTLFRLLGGEVTFDGLQFLLKPSRPRNPQTVAAVTVVGGKACTFTNCVFTLAEEDEAKAAVVLVADPDKVMAMDGAVRPTPDLKFDRCVIRGKGRGVWVPVSRAVKVEASQTLTAVEGPLFLAEPAGKALAGARSYLKLNRVTALVGGPVVELKAGKAGEMMRTGGLVPLDVDADECLFVGVPGAGQPLVELDGIDAADVKTVLTWQIRKANRYANFDAATATVLIRPGDGSTPKEWDWNQWIAFSGEPPAAGTTGKPVGKVTFERGPAGLKELAALKPTDAVVKEVDFPDLTDPKPTDAGAESKSLPVPWSVSDQ
jgi:predicted Ser/Thr protein kinase